MIYPNEKIRTLGLYQPFAALMLHGKVETRWVGKSRLGRWKKPGFPLGKYLIYSCNKFYDVFGDDIKTLCSEEILDEVIDLYLGDLHFRETGSALCMGDLVRIIDPLTQDAENTFVKFEPADEKKRRVGLVFENVVRIKPFPFKGKQGIGILSYEDRAKIEVIL